MELTARGLRTTVMTTLGLLGVGAFLVVLGIFDQALDWNIFSPRLEKVLWGIFGSSVALAAFGVAASFVLALRDGVASLRALAAPALVAVDETQSARAARARRRYLTALTVVVAGLALTIAAFGVADRRLAAERSREFKSWVRLQVEPLAPQLAREVEALGVPSHEARPQTLLELLRTLDGLLSVRSATLFFPDPTEDQALWQLSSRRGAWSSANESAFERRFIAQDRERAIRQALSGDRAWIEQINGDRNLVWHHVVDGAHGDPLAVLVVEGAPGADRSD